MTNPTKVERMSDREMVATRRFDAPPRLVFQAWTTPALFMRWWVPKSVGIQLLSCDMDVREGGRYRLEFGADGMEPMAFFGRYVEVDPPSRLVWTNDEGDGEGAVTTVTFEEQGGGTLLTYRELYPSKESLEADLAAGSAAIGAAPEQFDQLEALLAA